MKLILLSAFLIFVQLSSYKFQELRVISSYDENIRKATEESPQTQEKVTQLFAKLQKENEAEGSTESIKTLKGRITVDTPYLESGDSSIWNGGSERSYQIGESAVVALKAYKELLSTEKDVLLNYGKKPATIPAPFCPREDYIYCNPSYPYRTSNGSCNNIDYPWWGMAESPYKRLLPPDYDDGVTVPRIRSYLPGKFLPNARRISLIVHKPHKSVSDWTNMMMFFGQSVAHDLSLIASATEYSGKPKSCSCYSKDPDCFNIPIPYEDYYNKDQACITFVRSSASVKDFDCNLGPREQLNLMTHWLDLSTLYGTSTRVTNKLRLYRGGLLKYSLSQYSRLQELPRRPGSRCPTYSRLEKCFIAGDPRVEDNDFLKSVQTIWLREHNRCAKELSYLNPKWDDETLFQECRRFVIAEMQHITYAEYLPVIVGDKLARLYGLLPLEKGYFYKYDPKLYPQIANEFSAAAYRYCHTMVPLHMRKADSHYNLNIDSHKITDYYMLNKTLSVVYPDLAIKGSMAEWSYYPTTQVNYYLNNHLFDSIFPDSKRFSLPALNIQRGRDHGIPSYNYYRELCGLNYANSFDDLYNIPPFVVARLKSVYAHPSDIDLWTGLVSEYPVEGGTFGATAACIMAKQFRDLKYGDRFYYENGQDKNTRFTLDQLTQLRYATWARILCDNLDIYFVQQYPFLVANRDYNRLLDCKQIPRVNFGPWKDYY